MKTECLPINAASIERAAILLRAGETVAFPTETVYGLGANALDAGAVRAIFEAKGRPADNPLIVHIAAEAALESLTEGIDTRARLLMRAFWPGPLTLVLPRAARVPAVVSAGLPTVAVRMPAHPAARALIEAAGFPVAAPSANRSGRPSPTTAAHVLEDLSGRVPLILDGGPARIGVESTVVDASRALFRLLRPGGVTAEALRAVVPDLLVDPAVLSPLAPGETAASPGLKHRHYAPRARVEVVRGAPEAVCRAIAARYARAVSMGLKTAVLCATPRAPRYDGLRARPLGDTAKEMAASLFDTFRTLDAEGVDLILAEAVETDGMGLALMNRLLRAADFAVIDV